MIFASRSLSVMRRGGGGGKFGLAIGDGGGSCFFGVLKSFGILAIGNLFHDFMKL